MDREEVEQFMESDEIKFEQFLADMVPIDVADSRDIEAIFQIFEQYGFSNPSVELEVGSKLSVVSLIFKAEATANDFSINDVVNEIESNYNVNVGDFGQLSGGQGKYFVRFIYE